MKKIILLLLLSVIFLLPSQSPAGEKQSPLLILDAADKVELPIHFRSCAFPFPEGEGKNVSRQGFDELRVSGSHQFSAAQLNVIQANLPGKLTVVDLRQESHGFLDGAAISWYGRRNWANKGKSLEEVQDIESRLLASLKSKKSVSVASHFNKTPQGDPVFCKLVELTGKDAIDESEALARRGIGYFRIAAPDHIRPTNDDVERFIVFYRHLSPQTWLHFHCHAGHGRTTTFMLMVDMLQNANQVSFSDLAERQRLIGGARLVDIQRKGVKWREEGDAEREAFLKKFYAYAKANPKAQPLTWEQWLDK